MKEKFIEFLDNLKVDNLDDILTSLNEISKTLNQKYYNDSSFNNYLLVGSMGRKTSIKGKSDIDVIYELPYEIFIKFNNYTDNGQSKLLQEIKETLKERYSSSYIKGDGQVVVIEFKKYKIELVPAFKQIDDSYKYPDTHDWGSWKITKPLLEIKESNNMIKGTYTYIDLCQMIREWKANNGVTMPGILIDTLIKDFLDNDFSKKFIGKEDYYNLLINIFEHLKNQDKNRKQWKALGSNQIIENNNFNFITKAEKTYNFLINNDDTCNLTEIFGNKFPISKRATEEYGYSDNEQFIEDLYPRKILYSLKIDCKITQDGFRPLMLSIFISQKIKIKQNRKLSFFISECYVPKPYNIYWKVRNVGIEAIRRKCIRGKITKGLEIQNETANFYGPHYVECFIVKNGICVARDKISVDIDYN